MLLFLLFKQKTEHEERISECSADGCSSDLYGPETELGRRRTSFAEDGPAREIPLEAMIEKEPITVILSAKGWVRAMKGHIDLGSADAVKFRKATARPSPFTRRPPTSFCLRPRSEERRVGKVCVRKGRSGWS